MKYFLLLLGLWILFCVYIGVRVYFERDHKFGTHNYRISIIAGTFYFLSPVLLPLIWLCSLFDKDK
jgi:hypothetical protein